MYSEFKSNCIFSN